MKKTVITLSLLAGLLLAGTIACASSKEPKKEPKKAVHIPQIMRDSIEMVGRLHNQLLDSALADLRKEKARLLANGQTGFLETCNTDSLIENTMDRVMKYWFPNDHERIQQFMGSQPDNMRDSAFLKKRTPFQREYYDKLMAIKDEHLSGASMAVLGKRMSIDNFRTGVLTLEKEIEQKAPTVEEAIFMLVGTTTVRYSIEYWSENMIKWAEVLSNDE